MKRKLIAKLTFCPYCWNDHIELYRVGDRKQYYVWKCVNCGQTPVPSNKAEYSSDIALQNWMMYACKENMNVYGVSIDETE